MTFKEYYKQLEINMTWNQVSWISKEYILDDIKEYGLIDDEKWEDKSEEEKIKLFVQFAAENLLDELERLTKLKTGFIIETRILR
tara:strand:+ start:4025 stop:4279 length:255 start_codon:yes stop_codon:yes gene_type:complete